MKESGALLSAILRVTHPELFRAGLDSLRAAASREDSVQAALETWPTVFNAVQIICNRQSPWHRDSAGMPPWFDMLITLGSYKRATLVLRNLGVQVAYKPGSIALISSLLVHHGVAEVQPDRICYSWFMTQALHSNHMISSASWVVREPPVL